MLPIRPFLTLAVAGLVCGCLVAQQDPALKDDPLVVHEWGTFTSMQGSDGVTLEGLQWEEEALPEFVHSLVRFDQQADAEPLMKSKLPRSVRRVTQKMETPVLYFHTKTRRSVKVRVDFKNGLMTQWYPVADSMWPWPSQLEPNPNPRRGQAPFDLTRVGESHLAWHVELIPLSEGLPAGIPTVAADDIWQYAREVRAASVRTIPSKDSEVASQAERYLFYRGLGTFSLPVQVTAAARGNAAFHNRDHAAIPFAVAMAVDGQGGRLQVLERVAAGSTARFALGDQPREPHATFVKRMQTLLIKKLCAEGLGVDEATAMVRTWSRQWFTTHGNRVIYFLPRLRVDELLPLQITPTPDKIVRVLVGRLEYLTPEAEASLERDLVARLSDDPAERERARGRLRALGRFLEPKVRRILNKTKDQDARQSGNELLERLQRQ